MSGTNPFASSKQRLRVKVLKRRSRYWTRLFMIYLFFTGWSYIWQKQRLEMFRLAQLLCCNLYTTWNCFPVLWQWRTSHDSQIQSSLTESLLLFTKSMAIRFSIYLREVLTSTTSSSSNVAKAEVEHGSELWSFCVPVPLPQYLSTSQVSYSYS